MVSPSYSSAILGLPSVVKFSGSLEFWVDFQLCEELGDGGLVSLIPVLLGIDRIYERLYIGKPGICSPWGCRVGHD